MLHSIAIVWSVLWLLAAGYMIGGVIHLLWLTEKMRRQLLVCTIPVRVDSNAAAL